jgi:hypothetical protein
MNRSGVVSSISAASLSDATRSPLYSIDSKRYHLRVGGHIFTERYRSCPLHPGGFLYDDGTGKL